MRMCLVRLRGSGLTILAFVALGIGHCFAALAGIEGSSNNPYQIIFRKNVFRLHPPVINAKPLSPAQPVATIILTGITTMLGEKRAFLEITPPAKPPQPVKQESCVLTEGQREGQVEVIEIDPKAGSVKVSNAGTLVTLTFEKNGRNIATHPPRSLPRVQTLHLPLGAQSR